MMHRRFAAGSSFLIGALGIASTCSLPALADNGHEQMAHAQNAQVTPEQKRRAATLLEIVRDATRRFQNVAQAEAEGYSLMFGCVSGESDGAMGLHYVNGEILNGGNVEAAGVSPVH